MKAQSSPRSRRQQHLAIGRAIEPLENRLLFAAGMLDPSFDVDGVNLESFRDSNDATGVVQVPGSKKYIVVATVSNSGGDKDAAVIRFNNDGTLDTTFGNNGITIFAPAGGADDIPTDVALDANNNIYISGLSGSFDGNNASAWVFSVDADGNTNTAC
jgi:hypothetical protein